MTPESARELVDDLRAGKAVAPSRGAPRLATWKQAGRILAGFPDDQATGGSTAGHATVAGLRIAKEHGWTPEDPE
jgi:NADH-quinone oxidoreductase subunit E